VKKLLILRVKPLGRASLSLGGLVLGTLLAITLVPGSAADVLASQSSSESESSALLGIRTIVTAEFTYASTYKMGYSRSLANLGETLASTSPSASRAGFIDNDLGQREKERVYIHTLSADRAGA
jgi:hypothetical protein